MPIKVLMPQLGESVNEGVLTKWLKNKGEEIKEFDPLLEVNTDKVDTEIPSPATGVLLDILVKEGTVVTSGTVLAWIGEEGEKMPEPSPDTRIEGDNTAINQKDGTVEDMKVTAPSAGRSDHLGFISPVVTKIAGENNVNLQEVKGTGKDGRITKRDVLAFLENRGSGVAPLPSQDISAQHKPASLPSAKSELEKRELEKRENLIPLNPMRLLIADHMVRSKHTSAHVTTVMEVDLSDVVAHREANKESFAQNGIKLTYTPYFITASVKALKLFPIVNSSWSDEGIVLHRDISIGVATSLGEEGLIVPVIHIADSLSLKGLANIVNDLAARARAKKLEHYEVQGGTFTITNHGTSGSLFATPIINRPQCGILGIGMIQKRAVVINNAIAIRPMAYLSLTFDHRILDGAIADTFLGKMVESLQNWGE